MLVPSVEHVFFFMMVPFAGANGGQQSGDMGFEV